MKDLLLDLKNSRLFNTNPAFRSIVKNLYVWASSTPLPPFSPDTILDAFRLKTTSLGKLISPKLNASYTKALKVWEHYTGKTPDTSNIQGVYCYSVLLAIKEILSVGKPIEEETLREINIFLSNVSTILLTLSDRNASNLIQMLCQEIYKMFSKLTTKNTSFNTSNNLLLKLYTTITSYITNAFSKFNDGSEIAKTPKPQQKYLKTIWKMFQEHPFILLERNKLESTLGVMIDNATALYVKNVLEEVNLSNITETIPAILKAIETFPHPTYSDEINLPKWLSRHFLLTSCCFLVALIQKNRYFY